MFNINFLVHLHDDTNTVVFMFCTSIAPALSYTSPCSYFVSHCGQWETHDKILSNQLLQQRKFLYGCNTKTYADTTLTKNVLNEICKDTIVFFNEDKTPALEVLKVDLTKVKGTKYPDCYGCPTHCVDYRNHTWFGPRFHKENKARPS
jgi:hypothetical protein